jgi:hypothetical protein
MILARAVRTSRSTGLGCSSARSHCAERKVSPHGPVMLTQFELQIVPRLTAELVGLLPHATGGDLEDLAKPVAKCKRSSSLRRGTSRSCTRT